MSTLYRSLPQDVQRHIARFLPLWQRHGLHRPPFPPYHVYNVYMRDAIACTCAAHHAYYHVLRRCPKGAKWVFHPSSFSMRRQRSPLQWALCVVALNPTEDHWRIFAWAQWPSASSWRRVQHLFSSQFWRALPHEWHDVWLDEDEQHICFEQIVVRPTESDPPTRQASANTMTRIVRELDHLAGYRTTQK